MPSSPWQVRDSELVAEFVDSVRGVGSADCSRERRVLRKFCKGAWHGKCYRQAENDVFPVLEAEDLDDSMLVTTDLAADDPERFKLARDGDHLMRPFQCDGCHFQNLKKARQERRILMAFYCCVFGAQIWTHCGRENPRQCTATAGSVRECWNGANSWG